MKQVKYIAIQQQRSTYCMTNRHCLSILCFTGVNHSHFAWLKHSWIRTRTYIVRFKNNVRTVRTIELWAQAQSQAINTKAIEVRRKLMIGSAFLANVNSRSRSLWTHVHVRYMLSSVRLSSVCVCR